MQASAEIFMWIFGFFKNSFFTEHLRTTTSQISMMLTLLCRRSLSYRNQPIDLLCKSMDWFLYDNGLCHENVKSLAVWKHCKIFKRICHFSTWMKGLIKSTMTSSFCWYIYHWLIYYDKVPYLRECGNDTICNIDLETTASINFPK